MDLSQRVDVHQELRLTTELRQGISIIQMSAVELSEYVKQCVEENPFLDDDDWDHPRHPLDMSEYSKTASVEALSDARTKWDIANELGFDAVRENDVSHRALDDAGDAPGYFGRDEGFSFERYFVDGETLADHLLEQLRMQPFDKQDCRIGEYLIGSLDENGYLQVDVGFVASELGVSESDVERVLAVIQRFDPVGSGARTLAECFAVQAEAKGALTDQVKAVLDGALSDLGSTSMARIARKLGMTVEELDGALAVLRTCEPHPGAQFGGASDPLWPEVIVERIDAAEPDALKDPKRTISQDDGRGAVYAVRLQDVYLPHLQINAHYRTLANTEKSKKTEAWLKSRLKEAENLVDSIKYRKATLFKVACCIVEMQQDFFDQGMDALRPLTMEQVARAADVSESTVSRLVNGNYMQTPRGVFELRFFFQAKSSSTEGFEVSQASVKHRIAQLVEGEDPACPLSDQEISELLKKEGVTVSRRTVNKYRLAMGIPQQSLRKR